MTIPFHVRKGICVDFLFLADKKIQFILFAKKLLVIFKDFMGFFSSEIQCNLPVGHKHFDVNSVTPYWRLTLKGSC